MKYVNFVIIYFISIISVQLVLSNLTEHSDFFKIVKDLRASIDGYVLFRGSPDFETARSVHNGACRNIFPLILVKPLSTQDVAVAVKFSIYYDLKLSVRSGGHSYQCLGTKADSLHIDLRPLNEIQFHESSHMVRIGAGATWGQVLDVVDPKKYTMIHGNAKNVGVGGYLLGVGVNPIGTTHRHGYGADHVMSYKMVLADGSIAMVDDSFTKIIERDGETVNELYSHNEAPNLRYGLRGAGPSFGVVTEFLYKVYPHPETLSCVVLIYIESGHDLQRLVDAGQDGRYGITLMHPMVYRRPKPAVWLAWIMIKAPQLLKWQSGRKVEPVVVSVVDLKTNSGKTSAGPALAFLKSYGLDVALDNVGIMEKFGLDGVNLAVEDQDSVYLTKDELKAEGYHGMASVNVNGLYSYKALEDIFLHHPIYGIYNRKTPRSGAKTDCDFCLWILYIGKQGVNDDVIADTDIGPLSMELACTYNAGNPWKAKRCPAAMAKIQKQLNGNAKKIGETPRKYVNTPGCHDDDFFSFGERYWGNSYKRLLTIKKFWDPNNIFNYCHSVGSTEENCCAV